MSEIESTRNKAWFYGLRLKVTIALVIMCLILLTSTSVFLVVMWNVVQQHAIEAANAYYISEIVHDSSAEVNRLEHDLDKSEHLLMKERVTAVRIISEEGITKKQLIFTAFMNAIAWGTESEPFKTLENGKLYRHWQQHYYKYAGARKIIAVNDTELRRACILADILYHASARHMAKVLQFILLYNKIASGVGKKQYKKEYEKNYKMALQYLTLTKQQLKVIVEVTRGLLIQLNKNYKNTQRRCIVAILIFNGIVIIGMLFFFLMYFSFRIINPVRNLIEKIKGFKEHHIIEIGGVSEALDEIGELEIEFGEMQDDIVHYMAREEKIAKTLATSNRDLKQFAYVVSHDLQEPLRSVMSFTQLIEERLKGKEDKELHEFFDFVIKGTKRMKMLIYDLLEFSRVDTRAAPFKKFHVEEAINQAQESLKSILEGKNTKVIVHMMPEIIGDMVQISVVFQNLILNGVKYNQSGEPVIELGFDESTTHWKFHVKDNGIGIEKKHLEEIFNIFQRLHEREEYSGTGIGLAICRRIVERHGGRIWAKSGVAKGTTFYFTIPKKIKREETGDDK